MDPLYSGQILTARDFTHTFNLNLHIVDFGQNIRIMDFWRVPDVHYREVRLYILFTLWIYVLVVVSNFAF